MIAGDQFVLLLDAGTGRHAGLVDRHLFLDFFLLRGSFLDHLSRTDESARAVAGFALGSDNWMRVLSGAAALFR